MKQIYKNKKRLGSIVIIGLLLIAYNNCSNQKFSFAPSESFSTLAIPDIDCKSVVVLTPPSDGSMLRIPARGAGDVCYSLKLVSTAATNPSSSSNADRDLDVISSDHDANNKTLNSNPYVMGREMVNLMLEGPRAIMLSGSSNGLDEIRVDNFILVGVMPSVDLYNPSHYKAYGTSDCRIHNVAGNTIGTTSPYNNTEGTSYLSFKNIATQLIPFAAAGTASVTPLRVDGRMETNKSYSIDFRALDCGGIGYTSDIYLSFE